MFGLLSPPTQMPMDTGRPPELVGTAAPQDLARADHSGCPLELLRGQQPKGVAGDHGGPGAVVPVRQPAVEDGERGQGEVRLGLAAAGGEPDEVDQVPVGPQVTVPSMVSSRNPSWNGRQKYRDRGYSGRTYGVPATGGAACRPGPVRCAPSA